MVLGFNHNIRYKGELFHVQTEDSGRANPHIITLLYRGGTILASAKTSYADIIKVDQLESVVESIMKEQHKDMMRRLKSGEFDQRIFPSGAGTPSDAVGAPSPARSAEGESRRDAAPTPISPATAQPAPLDALGAPSPARSAEGESRRDAAPTTISPAAEQPAPPHPVGAPSPARSSETESRLDAVPTPIPAAGNQAPLTQSPTTINNHAAAVRAASANQLSEAIRAASAPRPPQPQPAAAGHPASAAQPASKHPSPPNPPVYPAKRSLDEVILDYLITGEEK